MTGEPTHPSIVLVGCGKMGGALLKGWLARGQPAEQVTVVEPASSIARSIRKTTGVQVVEDPADLPSSRSCDVLMFAVKPQELENVVPEYRERIGDQTVVVSIAAGCSISFFESRLGNDVSIVRTMPNTPAAIGRGISAACANRRVTREQRSVCQGLLEAVGEAVWVENESLIDPVTAVSGSGPAYVFLLIESLAKAGVAQGLPQEISRRLALSTVAGAGELARLSDTSPDVLRRNVTSPGGTTQAALEVLMADDGLTTLMDRAVAAATRRSRELAG